MYTDKMRLGKLDVLRAVHVLMPVEASINVAVCKYIVALKQSFLQSILDWKTLNLCQPGNHSCFYCHLLSVNQLKSKLGKLGLIWIFIAKIISRLHWQATSYRSKLTRYVELDEIPKKVPFQDTGPLPLAQTF